MNEALLQRLQDPKFYLESFCKVKGKKAGVQDFILNEAQKDIFNTLATHRRVMITKARQIGFCLSPNQRILTADLRWVSLDEIATGQEIVAVSENATKMGGRLMKRAVVEAKWDVFEPAFKLKMRNGVELIATAQHRFLGKQTGGKASVWKKVQDFKLGDIIRHIAAPWGTPDYEDGWFSGMLDGEGYLAKKTRSGANLTVSQVDGPVLERLRKYARAKNLTHREEIDKRDPKLSSKLGTKVVYKLVFSKMNEMFEIMGKLRPARFISRDWWSDKAIPNDGWSEIVSIEALPAQRMIDLQTSEKTFIVEGFVSHNSTAVTGLFYHRTIMTPGINTALIGYNSDLTKELLDKVKTFYRTTPDALKPTIQYNSKFEITFPKIDSKIIVLPSTENVGRGYTLHNVLCVAGNTEVFGHSGEIKKVTELKSGDKIINGNGGFSIVKRLVEKKNSKPMYGLTPSSSPTLSVTGNHEVLLRGGEKLRGVWVPAEDVKVGDYIAFPYFYSTEGKKSIAIVGGMKNHRSRWRLTENSPGTNQGGGHWKRGKFHYWVKIKAIELLEPEPLVYDVVLDSEPHSFLTTSGVVHNCTELPFWQKAEEKMGALEASVPEDGTIVIESTPNGVSNWFYRMWMSENDYEKKEYGWWWHYSEEEIDKIRRRLNNPLKFAQEYELTFLSSGRNVFDTESLEKQRHNLLKVGQITADQAGQPYTVVQRPDGLRVYNPVVPGRLYAIGVDTSEGVEGGDYSVAVIWDRTTGEEIGFFRGLPSPDHFATLLNKWGREFNNALMVVEINNHGLTTLTILKQLMYPSLYFRPSKFDTMAQSWSEKLGWRTTKVTRPLLIDDFAQAIREHSITIHSKELFDEMMTFIYDRNNNMVPAEGFHDDTIFAAGIGFQGFKVLYDKPLTQIKYQDYMPQGYSY